VKKFYYYTKGFATVLNPSYPHNIAKLFENTYLVDVTLKMQHFSPKPPHHILCDNSMTVINSNEYTIA